MIYKVIATNQKKESIEMMLKNPEKSGLNIKNITGISPIGADIMMVPFASVDGAIYSGSRVPSRNIVMTIGMYNEDLGRNRVGTIEESRLKTYQFFQIKDPIRLTFYTDHRVLYIDGYVESNDVDIFSNDETATISIICVDPWFYSVGQEARTLSGIRRMFEFPFSSQNYGDIFPDHSNYPWEVGVEFGDISLDTRMEMFYEGDIKNGFTATISFFGTDFHDVYIYNTETREQFHIYTDQIEAVTGDPLSAGDEIVISTVSGKKSAFLLRNGIYTNVVAIIDKNSDWIQLTKGSNILALASDYGVENINITIDFNNAYAGI